MQTFNLGEIFDDIESEGGTPYFVGGCVRDHILGITPNDIDIEVYNLVPSTLHNVLTKHGKVTLCGESFGVYKLGEFDFAIPRREKSTGRSHTTIEVDSDPYIDPKVACRRRDFTMNAMLMTADNEVIDFYGGVNDIKNKIVRAVDRTTFMEDPLRLIRAVKFASRYLFVIDASTSQLIRENRVDVANLPIDRIYKEITAILMEGNYPSYGIQLLNQLGLLEILLPDIWVLQGVEQNPLWHPEGDVLKHTCQVIDYMPKKERTVIGQLACLYHDSGKIFGSIGHEVRSSGIVRETFPRYLTKENEVIDEVANIVRNHMSLYGGDITRSRIKKIAAKIDVPKLINMVRADKLSRALPKDIILEESNRLDNVMNIYMEIKNEVAPIIKGRDIQREFPDINPGPIYSKILDTLYEKQLNDEFNTYNEGIVMLNKVLREMREIGDIK